jgi:hypothetical protein
MQALLMSSVESAEKVLHRIQRELHAAFTGQPVALFTLRIGAAESEFANASR